MIWGAAYLWAFITYYSPTLALFVFFTYLAFSPCSQAVFTSCFLRFLAISMNVLIWIITSVCLSTVKCFITESAVKIPSKPWHANRPLTVPNEIFTLWSRKEAEMSVLAAERVQLAQDFLSQLSERADVSIKMLKVKHPFCAPKSLIN